MADDEKKRIEDAKKAKQAEIDRKRAEVRKRMEEASKAKKAKKGFMTPDRKKKLRLLLRKKAAEELKKEQERKAAERRRIIEERCGRPKDLDDANEELLKKVLRDYHERINRLEDQKFDLEYVVKKKDFEIADLNSQVNDLRGKFVKPTLKKVSKYENKFAKLQKKAAEFNFRNQLKVVKKKEFTLEEEDKEKNLKTGIVDWSAKKDEKKGGEAPPAEGEAPAESAPPAEGGEGQKPAEGAEAPPAAEGAATEGAPAEGAPAEGAAAEGEKPAEGAEGQPAEGQPAEGQPAEPEQPPEPETPVTEDDLWFYIREAVTNANPLSPDELIKKLIDAVQGVPQKLMKPVVEASIKRSQSIDLTTIDSLEPVDPNAPPADPNAPPADPNAPPADPNAPPADPNAPPADPNAPPADPNAPPSEGAPAEGAPAPAEGAPAPAEGAADAPPAEAPPAEAPPAEAPPAEAPPADVEVAA